MKNITLIKILFVILCFVACLQDVVTQNPILNQQKYWYMRQRLTEKFLKVGPGHGESLPADSYEILPEFWWVSNSNINKRIEWGSETTYYLGYYIGVLATEIKLLRDKGEDYSETTKELYYALQAINRLDDYGEMLIAYQPPGTTWPSCTPCSLLVNGVIKGNATWDNTTQHWLPKPGSQWNTTYRNGYYIRNDAPPNFILNFPDANMWMGSQTRPWAFALDGDCNYGTYASSPNEIDFYTTNGNGDETSQDQTYSLLMGLKLVKQFVPNDVMYNGEYLREKAINIAIRLLSIFDYFYTFVSPVTGQPPCNAGNNGFALGASNQKLYFDFFYNVTNNANTQIYLWGTNTCNSGSSYAVNRQLYSMITAIANTTPHEDMCVYATSDGFDWGFFYLLRQALYPHAPNGGCDYDISEVLLDINYCPCRGPHLDRIEWTEDGTYKTNGEFYLYNLAEVMANAPDKWHVPNRYESACDDIIGSLDVNGLLRLDNPIGMGEFSGLDYMLLYNLANIVHGDGAIGNVYTNMLHFYFTNSPPLLVGASYHPVGFIDMKTDVIIPATTSVEAKASTSITLLPGFEAKTNSYFLAEIKTGQWTCVNDIYKNAPYFPTQVVQNTNISNRNEINGVELVNKDSVMVSELNMEVFPNPTYSALLINCNLSEWDDVLLIKFIDMNGRELMSLKGNCNESIDISTFSQGTYNMFIEYKLNNEFKQQYFKIIKL